MRARSKTVFHILRPGGSLVQGQLPHHSPPALSSCSISTPALTSLGIGTGAARGTEARKWLAHPWPIRQRHLRVFPPLWALQMWTEKCSSCFPPRSLSCAQENMGTSTKTGEWCLSSQCSSWTFSIWAAWVLCPLPSYLAPELSHFHTNCLFHHAEVWFKYGIKIITLPSTTPSRKVKAWQSWSNTLVGISKWLPQNHCQRNDRATCRMRHFSIRYPGNCLTWLPSIKLIVYYSIKNKEVKRQNLI